MCGDGGISRNLAEHKMPNNLDKVQHIALPVSSVLVWTALVRYTLAYF